MNASLSTDIQVAPMFKHDWVFRTLDAGMFLSVTVAPIAGFTGALLLAGVSRFMTKKSHGFWNCLACACVAPYSFLIFDACGKMIACVFGYGEECSALITCLAILAAFAFQTMYISELTGEGTGMSTLISMIVGISNIVILAILFLVCAICFR